MESLQKAASVVKQIIPTFVVVLITVLILWRVLWTVVQYSASISMKTGSVCKDIIDDVQGNTSEDSGTDLDYWAKKYKIVDGVKYSGVTVRYDKLNKDFNVECSCNADDDPSKNYKNIFYVNTFNHKTGVVQQRKQTCSCGVDFDALEQQWEVEGNDPAYNSFIQGVEGSQTFFKKSS